MDDLCKAMLLSIGATPTEPGRSWTVRIPAQTLNYTPAYSPELGLFVAVGFSGTILTSPDGITWTTRTSGTTYGLNGVTWSGTQFVAVGFSGTILTSLDGITWTSRTSGTTYQLNGVIWSGTQFVAVGLSGRIAISSVLS